jgi:ABC-2 type transport system permease protein
MAALPLRRLGRIAQGGIALGYALANLRLTWDVGRWLFTGVMVAGGAVFFMAIFILGATAAFWTPQTAELTNIFTYGGQFMTSYPMHIYQAWLRDIFTFIIPAAFINYYPALYLFGKPDPLGLPAWLPFLAPFTATALFTVSLALWQVGVRHYQSTGS